jgi:hypothetical protein
MSKEKREEAYLRAVKEREANNIDIPINTIPEATK